MQIDLSKEEVVLVQLNLELTHDTSDVHEDLL